MKRYRNAILVVGVALATFLAVGLCLPAKPKYQGKPVTYWILELARTLPQQPWQSAERPAKEALRAIGTNAVPWLANSLESNSLLTDFYVRVWPSFPAALRAHLPVPVSPRLVRTEAARMLEELVLRHPQRVMAAGIAAFRKALNSSDGELRLRAAESLGALLAKHHPPAALSALVMALDSPHHEVRTAAAGQLAGLAGPEAAFALPALRRCLRGTDPDERFNAAAAIHRITGETDEPIAVLLEGLKSPTPLVRGNAAVQLSRIGPAAKAALPTLGRLLDDPDDYARYWISEAVKAIEPPARSQTLATPGELIADAIRPGSPRFYPALERLAALGTNASSAAAPLAAALEHQSASRSDVDFSFAIAQTLLRIDEARTPLVVRAMTRSLSTAGRGNRSLNAAVLAAIGPDAIDAVPTLLVSLQDPDPSVRLESAFALLRIGVDSPTTRRDALQTLIRGLEPTRSSADRYLAARHLGELGSVAVEAVGALRNCRQEGDPDLEQLASTALDNIAAALPTGR
ncbi:MAG: HEAT repeat domain-containing protein [Verrucomicrobiales bacterium]|nr:HEAT repeat domain-containing protein [Verrucomicrobiales bacterium]